MATGDLTTLANVKAWLNVAATTDDPLLARLITAASRYAESWCGRTFASQAYVDTLHGSGGFRMSFLNKPVTAVSSLTIDGVAVPASSGAPNAGYLWDADEISLLGWGFNRGFKNIVMSYTAGFLVPGEAQSVPAGSPYQLAVTALAKPWNGDRGVSYAGGAALALVTSSPAAGQYSISLVSGVWTYSFAAADAGRAVTITYSYTPFDVEQAVIELIGLRYRERGRIGEASKSLGGQETASYSQKDMSDDIKTLLGAYRRVVYG